MEGPQASYPGMPGGGMSAGMLRSKIRRAPKAASAAKGRDGREISYRRKERLIGD